MSDDLDLPYEEAPGGPIEVTLTPDSVLSGGVVVRAVALDTPAGRLPALIFDFYRVDGIPLRPVVLTNDDPDQLRKLVPLVESCVDAAIRAAAS